jgi:O-acetyl-ADP-ribose deacetylase (regulator of RNase III)
MITESRGNLLEADVDALVNTVNTVGVMGKGIALQFKRAFPQMFKVYAREAKRGNLHLGKMHVWETGLLEGPRFVINFPTKSHWKANSRLSDIELGLDDLVAVIHSLDIRSIAIPPLGCGHGGLQWRDVEPLIRTKLEDLDAVDVQLFPPAGTPSAASMPTNEPVPAMTHGRAALIEVLARYARTALDGASPIEVQKLMYFLQVAGEDLRLDYARNLYGPYADNLRHVLRLLEGHYTLGYGDGSQLVEVAEPLRLLPGAVDSAHAELQDSPDTIARIERLVALVDGWESTYSLELLATVHWVLSEKSDLRDDEEALVDAVHGWSARKKRMSPERHIVGAHAHLTKQGWVAAGV